jgi:hypothetical protein
MDDEDAAKGRDVITFAPTVKVAFLRPRLPRHSEGIEESLAWDR